MVIFGSAGAGLATWFPYVPYVQDKLDLSNATLGLVLLGMPIGSILAAQLTSAVIGRIGSWMLTLISSIIFFFTLPLTVLAPSLWTIIPVLMVLGATTGLRNVAMNTQSVEIERLYDRPILSGFHAAFSIGSLSAAGLAVLAIGQDWSPALHVTVVSIGLGVAAAWSCQRLLPIAAERSATRTRLARPNRNLLKLGIIAVCLLVAEGAMADWASVFVRTVLDASPSAGAIAYAAFVGMMALGRLAGDRLTAQLGPVWMLRAGGSLIAVGMLVAATVPSASVAILGFGCVGLGVSCGYPIVVSAAGRVPGMATAAALTVVVTIGSIGFLLGPPLIGLIAEATSLRAALILVASVGLVEIALSGEARPVNPAAN